MAFINIFGLRIAINPSNGIIDEKRIVDPPPRELLEIKESSSIVLDWAGGEAVKTAKIQWWLYTPHHTIYTAVLLEIEESADQPGEWFPVKGVQPQEVVPPGVPSFTRAMNVWKGRLNAIEKSGLTLQYGPFYRSEVFRPATSLFVEANRDVTFRFQSRQITSPNLSPVLINIAQDSGFTLNLGKSRQGDVPPHSLVLGSGMFEALTATRVRGKDIPFPPLVFKSERKLLSLKDTEEKPELSYLPSDASRKMGLHFDLLNAAHDLSKENPLLTPLYAYGCGLRLGFVEGEGQATRIRKATLFPVGQGQGNDRVLFLEGLGFGDSNNRPVVLEVRDELDLRIRSTLSEQRPTTFLIGKLKAPVRIRRAGNSAIHSASSKGRFFPDGEGTLWCEKHSEVPEAERPRAISIHEDMISLMAAPAIEFASEQRFEHPKPGESYVASDRPSNPEVKNFKFSGQRMALPLLPLATLRSDQPLADELLKFVNERFSQQEHRLERLVHETLFTEEPTARPTVKVSEVFRLPDVTPSGVPVLPEATLSYESAISFGPIGVELKVRPGSEPAYAVIGEDGNKFTFDSKFSLPLDVASNDFNLAGPPQREHGLPQGIVKFSHEITLEDIIKQITKREALSDALKFLSELVDDTVRLSKEWTGLVMFNLPLSSKDSDGPLKNLKPPPLKYLALSPQKNGRLSVSGRAIDPWPPKANKPGEGVTAWDDKNQQEETAFRLNSVDIAWYDSKLVFYHADADFHFKAFFGLDLGRPIEFKIIGSYDREKKKIRFIGQFKDALRLFNGDTGFGPIKQVTIKGAEVNFVQGRTAIHLDGDIELKEFQSFRMLKDGTSVSFKSLQVILPEEWKAKQLYDLKLDYPSLQFDFKFPPFRLGFLEVKLGRIFVDWHNNQVPWRDAAEVNVGGKPVDTDEDIDKLSKAALAFDLRLELMKLPELAMASVDRLIIDFNVGLKRNDKRTGWTLGRLRVRALSFQKLRLDLMRFLTLEAERAAIVKRRVDPDNVDWLVLEGIKVSILGKVIIEDLTAAIFSGRPDRRGFIGFLRPGWSGPPSLLQIHWVLIGHNVEIDDCLAKEIMEVKASKNTNDNQRIANLIRLGLPSEERGDVRPDDKCGEIRSFIPRSNLSKKGEWIFAAGFTFLGILEGKFLFQDNAYYGICLDGPLLKEWFGLDIAFSVLYIKGQQPNQDTFVTSVRIPHFTTNGFRFMGGVISVEIVMDGGFTLDVGFPWLSPTGGRQWDRALGAIVKIFQGSGGFYIRKRNLVNQPDGGGPDRRSMCLSGGYAIQVGLGTSGGNQFFKVWATVGVYFILEGNIHLVGTRLEGGRLVGANGLLGRAAGELNYWVISIRVEIMLSAETRGTLEWGTMCQGGSLDTRTKLIVDFEVFAGVRAEACIGKGWFKLCKGIEVNLPLRFQKTIYLSD